MPTDPHQMEGGGNGGKNPEVAGVSRGEFEKDVAALCQFVTEGIHIITDPRFVANPERGKIPAAYTSAHKAVDAMLRQAREKGLAVMVTVEAAKAAGVHLQNNSWTTKKGKVQGRPVVNGTGVSCKSGPQMALNKVWVKEKAALRWGAINHPTLIQIAQMLCRVATRFGKEEVVLWKTDIKGAFTLLWVRPEDCKLLGCEMFGGGYMLCWPGCSGCPLCRRNASNSSERRWRVSDGP